MQNSFYVVQRIKRFSHLFSMVVASFLLSLLFCTTVDAAPLAPQTDLVVDMTKAAAACDLVVHDEASLREAIDCINLASGGSYTMEVTTDIFLTQPSSPITNTMIDQLTILGNGHAIDAQERGRVLTLDNVQNLTLQDLTLTGGKADVNEASPDGGGLALTCSDEINDQRICTWTLRNVVVSENQANNGGGINYYCGYHGDGALLVYDSVIRANEATNQGGGIIYSSDEESGPCSVTLRNTLVEGNQAVDGGGLRILRPRVTILDSTIRDNRATQFGGGLVARISDGFIDMNIIRSTISGNRAGGNGGGLYIASPDQRFDINLINSTVSSNTVDSGTGGGLYLRETGGSLKIGLINSTVTQNAASQGAGVQIFDLERAPSYYTSTLRLTNSIIAENIGSDCAGDAAPGVIFTGQRVLSFGHNLDSDGSCLSAEVRQPSDIPSGNAHLGPLTDNGGPTFTHALLAGSDALDAADDTVCAADPVNGVDQRGVIRPQGAHCDTGAYEREATATDRLVFVSSTSSGEVQGIRFNDEDILGYSVITRAWTAVFDGSDVGITGDVDAFAFLDDGSLLLSLDAPATLAGVGEIDDSDIVRFLPTKLGNETAGTFTWYLDGSDVGLSEDAEDIDAIDFTPDGQLLVSPSDGFDANGVVGRDEDLFVLQNAGFGAESSGVWQIYLDGSDVEVSSGRDINGLWVDPATGDLYLSTNGTYTVTGLSGDEDDIFICTPTTTGVDSACTFRAFWNGDEVGFGSERPDGIDLGPLPATFDATAIVLATEATEAMEDEPWLEGAEEENLLQHSFLPLVKR